MLLFLSSTWIRRSSVLLVFTKENLVRTVVSQPRAMATTPIMTATPMARRIHASQTRDFFIVANTLFPANRAIPKDVAAPSAKENRRNDVRAPGPWRAAPVRINPRIGPAQGAQSRPVEIPSRNDVPGLAGCEGPP